jgi:hypothetical protein
MLPVTLCEKPPDSEAGVRMLSKGALPVNTWLEIETVVAALAPCENAHSPKMLTAKAVEWHDLVIILGAPQRVVTAGIFLLLGTLVRLHR